MSDYVNTSQPPTVKPVAAGIINIVIGALLIAGALIISFGLSLFFLEGSHITNIFANIGLITAFVAFPVAAIGVLCVTGGICNLKRVNWGLALAASIATALLTVWGIAAVILTIMSKDEFPR